MLKLVKNQDNHIQVSVSSTIDLTGFSAKVTINGVARAVPSLVSQNIYFDFTASDVASIGNGDYLAPIDILKADGNVYTRGLIVMRAVNTAAEAIGFNKIYLVIVGEIASPTGSSSLDEEIAARKAADIAVLANAKTYTNEKIKKSKLFVYAGQVNTVADLPATAEVGEVYNVVATGANYAWSGTVWDKLSENIDLSVFAKTSQLTEETNARTAADTAIQNTLTEEINIRSSQAATLTQLVGANSEAITNLNEAVALKADKTAVESLQTEVGTLSTAVGTKASKTELEALQTTVGTKASQADLTALETTVGTKASAADLTALETTVGTKADASDVTALSTKVDGILNGTTFISSIVFKNTVGSSEKKYRLQVTLADNGKGGMEPVLSLVEIA